MITNITDIKVDLKPGTQVYYGGTMENNEEFGVVIGTSSRNPNYVEIEFEESGRKHLPRALFSTKYDGTGYTNFTTKAAYDAYHEEQQREFKERFEKFLQSHPHLRAGAQQ